jgi:hypothetical protein
MNRPIVKVVAVRLKEKSCLLMLGPILDNTGLRLISKHAIEHLFYKTFHSKRTTNQHWPSEERRGSYEVINLRNMECGYMVGFIPYIMLVY